MPEILREREREREREVLTLSQLPDVALGVGGGDRGRLEVVWGRDGNRVCSGGNVVGSY